MQPFIRIGNVLFRHVGVRFLAMSTAIVGYVVGDEALQLMDISSVH